MLPLPPELPEGRETMASMPEAINLVKSTRSDAGSPGMGTQHGSTSVEGKSELPLREDVQVQEGSNQGSINQVTIPINSANDQGMKRFPFREPAQLYLQSEAEKRLHQGTVGVKDQLPRMAATDGTKHPSMENGRWMASAVRPNGPDAKGAATNMSRDANSDDEYIDVETFDPVEDRRQSLLDQSSRIVEYNRVQFKYRKIPYSAEHQHISRRATDVGGEHSAIDDDRIPSMDSGFYSDEEVRVGMRGSSSDWSDSVGETYKSKASGTGRLSSSGATPEDADKSLTHSYRRVHAVNEDTLMFSPTQPNNSSDQPTRHHELQQVATFKQHRSSTEPPPIPVAYVKSYGGYTVYIPGKVQTPEKDISISSKGNVTVPNTVSGAVVRNGTEVVYTMDTSAVRMSTSTSSEIDSRALYENTKPAATEVHRRSVLVATDDSISSERDLIRLSPEDAGMSSENMRAKYGDRSNAELVPDDRDEVSHQYLQKFSSYSPDRAVIIPIPSDKSAFVNTSPNSAHRPRLKAMVTPVRYLRVEGSVPETRNFSDRSASDFERMAPPMETVRRYIPSTTYLPRAYVTHPYRMVAANPVSSRIESDTTMLHRQANGKNVHQRLDARMTPENSRESEYVYHRSKPVRVVYNPISDIADDEPPRKVSRLTCGSERLLSIAEIEHESLTAPRHSRYPMTEAMVVDGQSRGGEGRTANHRPLAYSSQILKTYLRGQDVLEEESLDHSNSPASRGEVPESETSADRDFRPWFRHRFRAEEEVSRNNRREQNAPADFQSVARGHEVSFRKPLNEYNSNGDASVTLDLSKKYGRDVVVSVKEAVQFTRVQPRYVSSEESYSAELRAKLLGEPVMTPTSVIVTSAAGNNRSGVPPGGAVVRTVIVSADRSKVSSGQKSFPEPELGTERVREVRAEGRDAEPTTVLAPEPGGQRSRYMITREGDGNRFVIREVECNVKTAAGQLVAIKDRIESELGARSFPHYPIGAVQVKRLPKDASGGEVRAVHPTSPADDRNHPMASVIRTAPSTPTRDTRSELQRRIEDDEDVVEVYRVRRVLPSGMPHFEPTAAECVWADAEWEASGSRLDEDSVYGAGDSEDDRSLRLRVAVVLWSLLGGDRLRAVGWPRQPVRRVLWRTVDVCCAVAGAKSPAAVPLPPDHDCGADMACFRDHAHRFLEVCAPTRDHWKRYGWASLTIDAVVAKVYREDIAPWLRTLPDAVVPALVRSSVRRLSALRGRDSPPPPLPLPPRDVTSAPAPAPSHATAASPAPAVYSPVQRQPLPLSPASSEDASDARKKRGRPAKAATKADAGRTTGPRCSSQSRGLPTCPGSSSTSSTQPSSRGSQPQTS